MKILKKQLASDLADVRKENKALADKNSELTTEYFRLHKRIEFLSASIDLKERERSVLAKENDSLRQQVSALKQKIVKLLDLPTEAWK